jgi:hypothetical protein
MDLRHAFCFGAVESFVLAMFVDNIYPVMMKMPVEKGVFGLDRRMRKMEGDGQ